MIAAGWVVFVYRDKKRDSASPSSTPSVTGRAVEGSLAVGGVVLRGRVMLVGRQHELTPAAGVVVTLEETGEQTRTQAGGLFELPLPEGVRIGERITVQVDKEGWRIQYPLDGELRVPEPIERTRADIRLLPLGSKKWWSDDRIEKFFADPGAGAREQIGASEEKQEPDFGRFGRFGRDVKAWAEQYGFSEEEVWAHLDQWGEKKQKQKARHPEREEPVTIPKEMFEALARRRRQSLPLHELEKRLGKDHPEVLAKRRTMKRMQDAVMAGQGRGDD